MKPTILAAVDRAATPTVTRAASSLASRLGAAVVLAHVAPDNPIFNSPVARERRRRISPGGSAEILDRARAGLPEELPVRARAELGDARVQLLKIASDEDAQLIVVGAGRRHRFVTALVGSISRTLAAKAPCPVVIVPRNSTAPTSAAEAGSSGAQASSSVVCGVDGSHRSLRVVEVAVDLASRLRLRLLVVHAEESGKTGAGDAPTRPLAVGRLTRVVQAMHPGTETRIAPGAPATLLEAVADRESAALIVVGARESGGLKCALGGSVSRALVRRGTCPVLVLPPHAAISPKTRHYEIRPTV